MSRPALVLVHGWGLGCGSWAPLDAALERDFTVHRLALPGYDGSPAAGAAPEDWADILLDRAPARATWVGASLGGILATEAATRAPGRCEALVTIGSNPCFVHRDDWPHAMALPVFREFSASLDHDPERVLRRFMQLATMGSARPRADLARLHRSLDDTDRPGADVLAAGLRLLRETDARGRLRNLRVPGLHLFGEHDALVPAAAAGFYDNVPGQRTVTCAGASHLPWLSAPHTVAELVRDVAARNAA